MLDISLASLAARVDELEVQATRLRAEGRRFKVVAAISCVALVGLTAVGAASAAKTSAPFAVVDAAGHTRVRLDANGLHVFDARGKERATVGFNAKSQPVVHLYDASGGLRESMYLSPKQIPGIEQYDQHGNLRSEYDLDTAANESSEIEFQGAEGNDRFYVNGGDKPFARFGDPTHANRAYFGLTAQGDGLMRMYDPKGKEIVSVEGQAQPFMRMSQSGTERMFLGVSTANNGLFTLDDSSARDQIEMQGGDYPFVRLYDSSHTERAVMGVYDDGSSGAALFGSDSTVLWKAP